MTPRPLLAALALAALVAVLVAVGAWDVSAEDDDFEMGG